MPACRGSGTRTACRPHRIEGFKLSKDKRFVEKLTDVVGVYLNPPDKALVLCVDEKSQVQALDRGLRRKQRVQSLCYLLDGNVVRTRADDVVARVDIVPPR
jgi:hypothetical protein